MALTQRFAAMDFDTDGCYNSPAIDADGNLATGLNCGGAKNGNCRDLSDLQNNNVYSRARCNNGWCAFMYGKFDLILILIRSRGFMPRESPQEAEDIENKRPKRKYDEGKIN